MVLTLAGINWLAVIVAAILNMALGALWYSRLLFGNLWMKAIGKSMDELGGAATGYIVTFIGSLVAAFVLALLVNSLGIATWSGGLLIGAVVSVGFVATATLASGVFNEISMTVWGIFAGYSLVSMALQGALLGLW